MTTIYLIRHAEAEGNLYRRIHGHTDGMITPAGMDQIRALAKRFEDIPVDACYASDLLRTRTTAQAVYVPKGLPLQTDARFRELYTGVWEDKPVGQLRAEEAESLGCFVQDPMSWKVEGSEPFMDYTGRFLEAMKEKAEKHDGGAIAIVTHSVVLQGVVKRLFPEKPLGLCPNTGVTKVEYENGQYRLVYFYDGGHLTALPAGIKGGGVSYKTEAPLWFVSGLKPIEGLEPPKAEAYYTALSVDEPVGVLALDEVDAKTGKVTYVGLLPEKRGKRVSVQLLGMAVWHFRAAGKEKLLIERPENGCMDKLLSQMQLKPDENGCCTMDIRRRVLPL